MQLYLSSPPKAFSPIVAIVYSLLNFTFVYGQVPTITGLNPTRNATSAPRNANVSVTFSQAMNAATDSNAAIQVHGSQTGLRTLAGKGSFSGGGTHTLAFDPATDFKAGEQVSVSVTAKAQSTDGTALAKPQVFQFTAASDSATATFTKASQTLLGKYPTAICPADLDGDGNVDLAAINNYEGGISLRFNDGKGNFQSRGEVSALTYASDMATADFDGDGDMDLAEINFRETELAIGRNDGKGNFNSGIPVHFSLDELAAVQYADLTHLMTGDWDNDGDVDLMVSMEFVNPWDTAVAPGISIFTNQDTAFINTPLIFRGYVTAFVNGDWDNDGDLDLAVATGGGLVLLFNDGAGHFSENTPLDLFTGSLQTGDFDNDGDLDLAAATTAGIAIRYNDGAGSFTGNAVIQNAVYLIDSVSRLSVADFNGDGHLDLACIRGEKQVSILLNNARGGFALHSSFAENTYLLAVADFNGDQSVDITTVTASEFEEPYTATIWLNGSDRSPTCTASGSILREVWTNLPGHNIQDIPVNTPSTSSDQLTSLRTRAGIGNNYGQRIRGYLCVPTTGNYTFFIQGDDKAELWLSTDNDPANKQRIASAIVAWDWTDQPSQQSASISLLAGQSYYLEVLHKEASGGDVVRVGWLTPDMAANAEPVIIPGSVLSPALIPPTPTNLSVSFINPSFYFYLLWHWKGFYNTQDYFRIERAPSANGPWTPQEPTVGKEQGGYGIYYEQHSVNGATYFYRVYEVSNGGASAYSNVVSVTVPPLCQATGTILREYWSNVSGNTISDIPLNTAPTASSQLTSFETARDTAHHYAERIRGYLCVPTTGTYDFYFEGDGKGELYVSNDTNPANKRLISGGSSWSYLGAGKSYYVELLHNAVSGRGRPVRVLWHTPDMSVNELSVVIPGSVLSPSVPEPLPPSPANGLLACYNFSGNADDGSGQGHNGTVNGATLTSDRFGQANSAYAFHQLTDRITIPATDFQNNTYSYSLWAKADSLPSPNSVGGLLSLGSQGVELVYCPDCNDKLYNGWVGFSATYTGEGSSATTVSLPMLHRWYHLVITRSSSAFSFYVNGQLVKTQAITGASAAYNNQALIGDRFFGAIDDVQIYNKVLSAAEITALYQQTGTLCPATGTARQIEPTREDMLSSLTVYPNPTTGTTTVEFTATETGWLGVQLYNLQGQPLQQLFGQAVEAGSVHQQPLDATTLPSGLYLIRMVNGKHVESHKLLVNH